MKARTTKTSKAHTVLTLDQRDALDLARGRAACLAALARDIASAEDFETTQDKDRVLGELSEVVCEQLYQIGEILEAGDRRS